jgi:hypothetical protein
VIKFGVVKQYALAIDQFQMFFILAFLKQITLDGLTTLFGFPWLYGTIYIS